MTASKEWFSAQDLAGLTGLPKTPQGMNTKAKEQNWQSRPRQGKGGGKEYHISVLPESIRQYLSQQQMQTEQVAAQAKDQKALLAIAEKLALQAKAKETVRTNHVQKVMQQAATLTGDAKSRFEARSLVLEMWQLYLTNSTECKTQATLNFLHMWHNNTFPIAEEFEWIRDYIGDKLNKATLYRWVKDPENLIPKYGKRRGQTLIDTQPEIKGFVTSMLYTHPQADSKDVCLALEARFKKTDFKLPSRSSIGRWLNRYKDENKSVYTAVTNPDSWKNKNMPAQGEITASALNERWEMDATPADWMFEDGRYSLLAKIDVYSRHPKVILSPTATSGAQAKLLRDCFMEDGIPQKIKTDNGADYISLQIRTALRLLDIHQDVSARFSPWEKPHIERFFRTLSHSFLEMLPGFIGHNVSERSIIEDRKQFSERLFKKDEVIEVKMTSEQFQEHINHWIDYVYLHEEHGGLNGKTPFEMLSGWTKPIKRVASERALDILLSDAGERVVGKEGIRMDNFEFIAPELGPLVGQKVQIRKDPVDVGTLYVFHEGKFVCIAEDSRFVGIRRQDIAIKAKQMAKAAIKEQKAEIRRIKSKHNTKKIAEEILEHKREQNNVSMLPKPTEAYTNEMLKATTEAAEVRKPTHNAKPLMTLEPVEQLPIIKDPQQIYRRYLRIVKNLEEGRELNQEDSRFYHGYHNTPECLDMKGFFEDFGLGLETGSN